MRHGCDESVLDAFDLTRFGDLAKRPNPPEELSVVVDDGSREALEGPPALAELELVEALRVRRCRELANATRVQSRFGHVLRDRQQTLLDRALRRDPELAHEPLHRLVRDRDPAVAVGQRDPVDRPVDQAAQQRRIARELALTFLSIRDVDDEALPIRTRSVRDTRGGVSYPDRAAIRSHDSVLTLERTT